MIRMYLGRLDPDPLLDSNNFLSPGLAVGVGFGAVGRTKSATFESARNLAIGIGIQNFPEVRVIFLLILFCC
jgi:hypothetical protein